MLAKTMKPLVVLGLLALSANAKASGKTLWDCDVTSGNSTLETVSVSQDGESLYGSVMYNRPFDDEASYDVRVRGEDTSGKLVYRGNASSSGSFDLVLDFDGTPSPGGHAHGVVQGFIPAKADHTGFGSEKYSNIGVDCTYGNN